MMPEHDPQPADGSEPGDDHGDARAPGDDVDDRGVVRMSTRRPATEDPRTDDADDTVVDLRRADAVEGAVPVERRSPEVAAVSPPPVPAVPAAPEVTDAPRSSLSSRVLRVVAPSLLVLAVATVATVVAVLRTGAALDEVTAWNEVAAAEMARADDTDAVWSGVLASVAAGVGQPVGSAEQLSELVGVISGSDDPVVLPDPGARAERDAAARERGAFAGEVRSALDRADGSPVALGNELSSLEAAHGSASAASAELVDLATTRAAASADDARASGAIAVLFLVLGLVGAVAAAELSRRRLRSGLDTPVAGLHAEVAAVATDAEPAGEPTRGFAELGWLVDELRRRRGAEQRRVAVLRRRAEWGDQSRRIFEALDLAEDEPSSYAVLERALGAVGADHPAELLLAERGSTSLRAVAANPGAPAPGCPVDSTVACVALRRGQVSVFDSSESINACPKLRGRPGGSCSAACVPVTVAGRPVGVLHTTAADGAPPAADLVDQLVGLATQIGTRFSALRTLESSRQEASTDGLTGLPNRRTLESQLGELLERETPFVIVLADLDRFKLLNDNFGHEVGDRALQLFAGVLRDNVRGNDVVARLGGEEFVLVYPNMSVEISLEAIDRVRAALARALDASTVPPFTCSFGIAHSSVGHDGDTVLRVADAGMLRAKDLGGDQAVVADAELASTIFSDDAPLRARRDRR